MAKNKKKSGLQKQHIKAAGGDFKKAWKLQKAAKAGKVRIITKGGKKTQPKKRIVAGKPHTGGGRTSKYTRIRMVPIAVGVNAAYQMGFVEAGQKLMDGDIEGAGEAIRENAGDLKNWIETALPAVLAKLIKQTVGSVPLIGFGKFKLDMF